MDKPIVLRPELPAINMGHIEGLLERDELITLDGEVLTIDEGTSDDVVAWIVAMKRIRDLARRMEDRCSAVMLQRVGEHAGPIETEYGTASVDDGEEVEGPSVAQSAMKAARTLPPSRRITSCAPSLASDPTRRRSMRKSLDIAATVALLLCTIPLVLLLTKNRPPFE